METDSRMEDKSIIQIKRSKKVLKLFPLEGVPFWEHGHVQYISCQNQKNPKPKKITHIPYTTSLSLRVWSGKDHILQSYPITFASIFICNPQRLHVHYTCKRPNFTVPSSTGTQQDTNHITSHHTSFPRYPNHELKS